jgi:hypothetical protein
MEMAVRDGVDLGRVDPDGAKRIGDPDRLWVVALVELLVPETKTGIEEQKAAAMPDELRHDHALHAGQLIPRKRERPKLKRKDLRGPDVRHATTQVPRWM